MHEHSSTVVCRSSFKNATWVLRKEGKVCLKTNEIPTECYISNVITHSGIGVSQFQGWLAMREEHLWRCVRCTTSFSQFLHEYFANDDIVLVPEDGAEDDGDAIRLCLHVAVSKMRI